MRKLMSVLLVLSVLLLGTLNVAATAAPSMITLDAKEGRFEDGSTSMQLDLSQATQLPTPSREGFAFGGWFTQENGQSEALRLPSKEVQMAETFFARWVPLSASDLFTVSVLWVDSTGQAAPGYTYRFLEQATGAQIDLLIAPDQDQDPQSQVARYTAQIHLPKTAPDGSPAVYGTVADADYGIVWHNGVAYTGSYREALRPEGADRAMYFQRERMFRRMIHPTLSVRWEGVSPSDLPLTFSAQPAFGKASTWQVSVTLPADDKQSQEVALFDLLSAERGQLFDLAWDELDYLMTYRGHNEYSLSALAPEGCEALVTGDARTGFTLTITKP